MEFIGCILIYHHTTHTTTPRYWLVCNLLTVLLYHKKWRWYMACTNDWYAIICILGIGTIYIPHEHIKL